MNNNSAEVDDWVDIDDWEDVPAKESIRDTFRKNMEGMFAKDDARDVERRKEFAEGVRSPLNAGARLLYNLEPESYQKAGDAANKWLYEKTGGVLGTQDDQNTFAKKQAAAQSEGFSLPRMIGNAVVTAPLAALGPALGSGVLGSALTGAGTALFDPVTDENYWRGVGVKALEGGALGGAIGAASKLAGKVLAPGLERTKEAEAVMKEGVKPTIGQQFGGRLNTIEKDLVGAPVAGHSIANARNQAIDEFNAASMNKAVRPINPNNAPSGPTSLLTGDADVGFGGIDRAFTDIDKVYDKSLADIDHVDLSSPESVQGIMKILGEYAWDLPDQMRNRLSNMMERHAAVIAKGGSSAETVKKVISDINNKILKFSTSDNADDQFYGEALDQFKRVMTEQIGRQNPAAYKDLVNADDAFKNMVRVGKAAGKTAEGKFAPSNLRIAIRELDKSKGGRAFQRGKAVMQDWAITGEKALGNTIRDEVVGKQGLMNMILNPMNVINPTRVGLVLGAAASDSRRDALAEYLMKKNSPFSEGIKKYGLSAIAPILGEFK